MVTLTKAQKDAIKQSWQRHTQTFGTTQTEHKYQENEEFYCKTITKYSDRYNSSTKDGKELRSKLIYQLSLYNEPRCD